MTPPTGQTQNIAEQDLPAIEAELKSVIDMLRHLPFGPDYFKSDARRAELVRRRWIAQGLGEPVF